MFKNAILYKIEISGNPDIESCLTAAKFMPCGQSQERSSGWVPPREVNGAMLESIGGQKIMKLMTEIINTKASPGAAMAEWLLSQDGPAGFSIDRECELKAADETNAVVKYGNHRLNIDEVPGHINAGKMPTKLAMTWDSRVSFVLTDTMQIKKLKFLDVVFESHSFTDTKDSSPDSFDADVAIATGELRNLIPDLLNALGGY